MQFIASFFSGRSASRLAAQRSLPREEMKSSVGIVAIVLALVISSEGTAKAAMGKAAATAALAPPTFTTNPAYTTLTIGEPSQFAVTFDGNPTPTVAMQPSPLPISFDPSTGIVRWLGATVGSGPYNVRFIATNSQGNASNYVTFLVTPHPQTFIFSPLSDMSFAFVSLPLSVTSDSQLTPIYLSSSTPATCVLRRSDSLSPNYDTVDIVGAGTCTIGAYQNGNSFWAPTASVISFEIAPVAVYNGFSATGTGPMRGALAAGLNPDCTFSATTFTPPPGPGSAPAAPLGVTFPDGLFKFSTVGCTKSVALVLTLPTKPPANMQFWLYGPTTSDNTPHWYEPPFTVSENVVTFWGDADDITVNGLYSGWAGVGVPIDRQRGVRH